MRVVIFARVVSYYPDENKCAKNNQKEGGDLLQYDYIGLNDCVTLNVGGVIQDVKYDCSNKDGDMDSGKATYQLTTYPSDDGTCTGKSDTTQEKNVKGKSNCDTVQTNGEYYYQQCSAKKSSGSGATEFGFSVGVIIAFLFAGLFIVGVCFVQFNKSRAQAEEAALRRNTEGKKLVTLFSDSRA